MPVLIELVLFIMLVLGWWHVSRDGICRIEASRLSPRWWVVCLFKTRIYAARYQHWSPFWWKWQRWLGIIWFIICLASYTFSPHSDVVGVPVFCHFLTLSLWFSHENNVIKIIEIISNLTSVICHLSCDIYHFSCCCWRASMLPPSDSLREESMIQHLQVSTL